MAATARILSRAASMTGAEPNRRVTRSSVSSGEMPDSLANTGAAHISAVTGDPPVCGTSKDRGCHTRRS
jgi:hypothetical protein